MKDEKKEIVLYSRLWGFVLIAVVLLYFIMRNPNYCVDGILKIQFSNDLKEFKELINDPSIVSDKLILIKNTYLDFVFIVLYTVLFLLSFKVFALSMGFKLKKFYLYISIIPGLLDIIENTCLLSLLKDMSNHFVFNIYYYATRIKWAASILFVFMVATIILYYGLVLIGRVYDIFEKK